MVEVMVDLRVAAHLGAAVVHVVQLARVRARVRVRFRVRVRVWARVWVRVSY